MGKKEAAAKKRNSHLNTALHKEKQAESAAKNKYKTVLKKTKADAKARVAERMKKAYLKKEDAHLKAARQKQKEAESAAKKQIQAKTTAYASAMSAKYKALLK